MTTKGGSLSAHSSPRRAFIPTPLLVRFTAVLFVPILLYGLYGTGLRALDNYKMNLQASALQVELLALRAENLRLQDDIEKARLDTSIESIARQELGLVRPGDHAVVLLNRDGNRSGLPRGAGAQVQPTATSEKRSALQGWFDHFFGSAE